MLTTCVLLTAVAVAYVFQIGRTEALLQQGAASLQIYADDLRYRLIDTGRDVDKSLHFLAQSAPVQGMIRAKLAAGFDPWDGSAAVDLRNRLESTFSAFLESNAEVFQLRFLQLGDPAIEIVRVERGPEGIVIAPDGQLQSEDTSSALRLGLEFAAGATYLFPIGMDSVNNGVKQPMLRAIAQTLGPDGQLFGALEIKRRVGPDWAAPLALIPDQIDVYIATEQGELLYHPKRGMALTQTGQAKNEMANLFPPAGPFLLGRQDSMFVLPVVGSGADTWFLQRVNFDPAASARQLVIALRAPYSMVSSKAHAALEHSIKVTVVMSLVAILLGILLGRTLTTPLKQLVDAAARIQRGQHDFKLSTQHPGELGLLARTFSAMATEVQRREQGLAQLTVELEQRVAQRSVELRQQTDLLELVIDNIGEGVIVVNPEGSLSRINRAGQRILSIDGSPAGFSEWRATSVFLYGDGDGDGEQRIDRPDLPLEQALKGVSVDDVTIVIANPNSDARVRLTASARPLFDRTYSLHGAVVTFRDTMAEYDAAVAQRLAAMVFEHSAQGVLVADAEQRILSVNKAFTDITGYTAEEAIGKTPRMMRSGVQGLTFYRRMWTQLLEAGYWEGELWNRRRNGERYAEHLSVIGVKGDDGRYSHFVGIFSDITERKRNEEQIYQMAHFDALSGLPNRMLFRDRLEHAIERSIREDQSLAVLFVDLDRFKPVNDTFGHAIGDDVLSEVAERLKDNARGADTVARFGGDEFAVVLEGVSREQAGIAAQRFLDAIRHPVPVRDQFVHLGASIGISMFPEDGADAESLLQYSDLAMYRVKERGKNGVCFFRSELSDIPGKRLRIEQRLHDAIDNQRLILHYQPQVSVADGRVLGVEALLRWHDDELGWISPADFIPIAEDTGLIVALGDWVLRRALQQRAEWKGLVDKDFRMAVNLSPRQLEDEGLAERVIAMLAENDVWPKQLELEITENALMRDPGQAEQFLQSLSDHGVAIAIDDFGSGYSSLAYIKRFPIDRLKIDRAFVKDVPQDADDCAIVRTVIAMAHALRLKVIAEGVESTEQCKFLDAHGCDEIQGYLCCKPAAAEDLQGLLNSGYWREDTAAGVIGARA